MEKYPGLPWSTSIAIALILSLGFVPLSLLFLPLSVSSIMLASVFFVLAALFLRFTPNKVMRKGDNIDTFIKKYKFSKAGSKSVEKIETGEFTYKLAFEESGVYNNTRIYFGSL